MAEYSPMMQHYLATKEKYKDSILFYLPIYHNERFVIRECIVIYYTLLTFTFSIVCGIISVIYRFKHS